MKYIISTQQDDFKTPKIYLREPNAYNKNIPHRNYNDSWERHNKFKTVYKTKKLYIVRQILRACKYYIANHYITKIENL